MGTAGWQYQELGSAGSGLQSLEKCRDTGLWTQKYAETRKGAEPVVTGKGHLGRRCIKLTSAPVLRKNMENGV